MFSSDDSAGQGYGQDMLFTDGTPSTDPKLGYRGTSAATAAGISLPTAGLLGPHGSSAAFC